MTRASKSLLKGLLGTLAICAVLMTTAGAKELETHQVQIRELAANSRSFVDQKVTVSGVLYLAPTSSSSEPSFVLVDDSGDAIPVTAWAPLEIPPSMPGNPSTTVVPETMRDYVGRRLSLSGDFRITDENSFQIFTDSAAALVLRDTVGGSAPVVLRADRPQTTFTPFNAPPNPTVVPLLKSGPAQSAKVKG